MEKIYDIYVCDVCGRMIEIVKPSNAKEVICCSKMMKKIEIKTEDTGSEKHKPFIEKKNETEGYKEVRIQIGEILHPMEEEHYIERVEIISPHRTFVHLFKPNDEPIITSVIDVREEKIKIRAFCNVHGVWETEIDYKDL